MCTKSSNHAQSYNHDYTSNYMIPYTTALDLIREHTKPINAEQVDLTNACGRILAADISAREMVPPFDNTAMDGYAVVASDLADASEENPLSLRLVGLTAAGESNDEENINREGTAWKIMTGAPVPKGYDAIIPVENTRLSDDRVTCFSAPETGAHIRLAGQDFTQNKTYLKTGQYINPHRIMALATLGRDNIQVKRKPRVVVYSTGKELVDDLASPLQPGQIRNSNKPYILSWLAALPVESVDAGTNHDEPEKFRASLKHHLQSGAEMIISSGAVSMGDFDFIPQVIQELGGKIIFHKSKIRPGKPILFAVLPGGTLYFGLPGNPISAAIGLRFFVAEAIAAMLGIDREQPSKMKLKNAFNKKAGFRMIYKSALRLSDEKTPQVEILEGQESFKIQPMIQSTGWLQLEESDQEAVAGKLYDYYPALPMWIFH